MLPIYLSVEGLYSYQQKQEIDFTKLTEAGLFGIFGNVGSGKSSLLEAIGFALYGETERLNKQEKRTYNMLNLQSGAARIVFEFLNFENRKFRFVTQWKRRKRFEDTTTLERYAYEWLDEEWKPLESADGACVTHLTYPNFRRTIIIPQGQFKEFLELRGKDRSEMMKDIFHLERFDLAGNVMQLQRQNNSRLDNLQGILSGFDAVSTEVITSKNAELNTAKAQLKSVREEVLLLDDHCNRLIESRTQRLELKAKNQELEALREQQSKIEQLEKEADTYERTQQAFRELLNQSQVLNKEKEQLTYKIEQLTSRKQQTLEQLEQKEEEWKAIVADYKQLGTFRSKIEDVKLLLLNRQSEQERTTLSKRLEDGRPFLEQELKSGQELQAQLAEKEQLMESLKEHKVDTHLLLEMETWYQAHDNLTQQITAEEKQLVTLNNDIAGIQEEFTALNVDSDTWEDALMAQESRLQQELEALQQQEMHLQVQVKLSEFADNLHEGEPCPLCGATAHPHIREEHDLQGEMQELADRRNILQQELNTVKLNFNQLNRSFARLKDKRTQLAYWRDTLSTDEQKRQKHVDSFVWDGFSATDKMAFLAYKKESQHSEIKIRENEAMIKELRKQIAESQQKVEKYKSNLTAFEQKMVVLDGLLQQNRAQLRVLREEDMHGYDEQHLQSLKQQFEEKIVYLEEHYVKLSQDIQTLKTAFAAVNAERGMAKEQFQQLYQQLNQCQATLSNLLAENGFNDIMEVQQILKRNLDIAEIRKNIHEFHVTYRVLLSRIEELEKRIADDGFTEEAYQEKVKLLELKKEELELQISITGGLEREYVRLQAEFKQKEKLLDEYEKLKLRKSNLTTLENLFRGAGFVNYVSSIHLRQLCEIANQRFHRLTKNNLSLVVNESNEFEVIDYLNNGYRRSVKTLSGGQSFQASLCLALALAENIQVLNKADKNFFFIDEGFGTQDRENINTVFETLQYLHKENRIVGIISHVDELKERIPRYVTIVNDPENGSQVNAN